MAKIQGILSCVILMMVEINLNIHQNEIHNNTHLQNEESAVLFGKHLSPSHTKLPSYPQYESTIMDCRHPHHENMNLILQHSTERFTYVRG